MEDLDLYRERERARIALLAAFRQLRAVGRLGEREFQTLLAILKDLERLPREQVAEELAALLPPGEGVADPPA